MEKKKKIGKIHRNLTDVDKYRVRCVDTDDIEEFQSFELFSLHEQFALIPFQAYHLHLTSIIPADREDEWDPRVYDQIQKHLNGFFTNDNHLIYEANVLFSLRNTIVVDIMRLINYKRAIVHCSIKSYLMNKKYGIASSNSRKNVIEMAKAAGKNFTLKSIFLLATSHLFFFFCVH